MPQEIIICTSNQGKLREFAEILDILYERSSLELDAEKYFFRNLRDLGITDFDPEETGSTYLENAKIKAIAGAKRTGQIALADDSGIEVKTLNGEPGIYSGRYLRDPAKGVPGLLKEMEAKDEREVRYVCALVLANPEGEIIFQTAAYWYGELATEKHGEQGFGFDPVVYPVLETNYDDQIHIEQEFNFPDSAFIDKTKTVAQMESREKNSYSHRFKAVKKLLLFLFKKSQDSVSVI
ncbi:MAG: non-canonical purine NTP pyrophosphatase [Candidatus Caenarcaniphilales bacterium]|nr:non-canonical purine NTP pyrophosphatase [Candidatus Caenarcaniphilales bacterium]